MPALNRGSWRAWLRALPQGSTYLGLTLVVVMWGAVGARLASDREQALSGAAATTTTLSQAFEEYTERTIKEVDKTLIILRRAHDVNPGAFDLPAFTQNDYFVNDVTLQIAQIGPDGLLKSTNLGPQRAPTDLSDREHFRFHRDHRQDELFISKPVLGRASGKWSIQLTRRLFGPNGEFAGVLVASVDPAYFGRFFGSMEQPLGAGGSVALVGRDGIVRARGSMSSASGIGQSVADSDVMRAVGDQPSGVLMARSSIDGVPRIIAYRALANFPLVVTVSQALEDVLAGSMRRRSGVIAAASLMTLVVLLAVASSTGRRMRLDEALAALKVSEARASEKSNELQVALGNMSQGIMMIDGRGVVAVLNRRAVELLGLPEEFITRRPTFQEVLDFQWRSGEFGPDGSAVSPQIRDFIRNGGTTSDVMVYERTRPNGVVLEIRSLPLPDGGIVRTYTDITERTHTAAVLADARDRAESASRARTAFLAMMSHEIRTPLNGVIGMASLLAGTTLDKEQRTYTRTLRDSAEHLLQIIDDVLDFSKLEADRGTFEDVTFDIEQTVESTLGMIAPRAAEKGLFVGAVLDPAIPDLVAGDAGALRQVLLNLVGNAVKFTERGAVTVEGRVAREGGSEDPLMLRFSVRDTGIGIDAAAIPALFREFSQLDGSIARRFGGTGLGLAISKHLVERLGGAIGVESEPGKGTTFSFTLPFRRAPGATRQVPMRPLAGQAWLAASDCDDARSVQERLLREAGATVEGVASCEALLDRLEQPLACDGIILDQTSGRLQATDCAQRIRNIAGPAAPRLVLVTRLGHAHAGRDTGGTVFDDEIPAPLTRRQILALARQDAGRSEDAPARPATLPPLNSMRRRVLVAEDNPTNRLVIRALLDKLGFEAVAVEDGAKAFERAREGTWDLILMDLMMPGMDGYEATRAIRGLPGCAGTVPIIALTADAMTTEPDAARAAGMDAFATKPISRERLEEVIRETLDTPRLGRLTGIAPTGDGADLHPAFDMSAWDAIREELDEDTVEAILATFLEDTDARLGKMAQPGAGAGMLAREAHALKSAAGTFGFAALSSAAGALEASAGTLEADPLRQAVAELRGAFEAGRRALDQRRRPPGSEPARPDSLVA